MSYAAVARETWRQLDLARVEANPAVLVHYTTLSASSHNTQRWAREMRHWLRFNAREAVHRRDGLYGAVLDIPGVPRAIGTLLMPLAASAAKQNVKDAKRIRSSAAIAVIAWEASGPVHWVEAGRAYQRLALQATCLGLRTAFINQPVEVAAVRRQFAAYLGVGEGRPDLVIRIGRGPAAPRSLRRPLSDVIVDRRAATPRRGPAAIEVSP